MQTRFGLISSFAALVAAVVLAWTGQWTGWFSPENPLGYLWVFAGLIVVIGLIHLIDRRIWVLRTLKERQAHREVARKVVEAERIATEERRRTILQALSEPVEDEPQSAAQ